MLEKFECTIAQFAEANNMTKTEANSFTNVLVKMGVVTVVGTAQTPGKGRKSKIYSYPVDISFSLNGVENGDSEV